MADMTNNGLVHLRSENSVADTMAALDRIVRSRGLIVAARIDHARAAADAGLEMPPTQLLIFGNPASGTPLMLAAPCAAIDLPLKALVWEDAGGCVWLSYNSPRYLQRRYRFPEHLIEHIDGIGSICQEAVRYRSD